MQYLFIVGLVGALLSIALWQAGGYRFNFNKESGLAWQGMAAGIGVLAAFSFLCGLMLWTK